MTFNSFVNYKLVGLRFGESVEQEPIIKSLCCIVAEYSRCRLDLEIWGNSLQEDK